MQVVGIGKQSVYVYYYPQYYQYHDKYYYPCKIGMSKHSAVKRVEHQVKTALPEHPVIALIIKTEHAYDLEQMLHHYLALKERSIDAPGKEWFNTTPEEVLYICQMLNIVPPSRDENEDDWD